MTDKMIEEIATDMNFACVELSREQRLEIARVLTNLDYRKIPEGSAVLSREDYEILINQNKGLKEENHTLRLENNDLEAQVEQARKETAKEILQSLLDFVNCEKINQGHSFEKIKETLIKVAKTYEVEVEE